jgi:hypothetical protein
VPLDVNLLALRRYRELTCHGFSGRDINLKMPSFPLLNIDRTDSRPAGRLVHHRAYAAILLLEEPDCVTCQQTVDAHQGEYLGAFGIERYVS